MNPLIGKRVMVRRTATLTNGTPHPLAGLAGAVIADDVPGEYPLKVQLDGRGGFVRMSPAELEPEPDGVDGDTTGETRTKVAQPTASEGAGR